MPPKYSQRRSLRLKTYDYSKPGGYFITICTEKHFAWFGNIMNETMVLSDAGSMVQAWWGKLSQKFDIIELDAFVVMPNHIHGIIFISKEDNSPPVGADPCVRPNDDPFANDIDPRPSIDQNLSNPVGADPRAARK